MSKVTQTLVGLLPGETAEEALRRLGVRPVAGGAVDTNLLLFSSAGLTVADDAALGSSGAAVTIGRTGLHRNAQLVCFVQQSVAGLRALYFDLELSVDATFAAVDATGVAASINTIATVAFPAGFIGKQTADVTREYPWQMWLGTEIQLRCSVRAPQGEGDGEGAGNWGIVKAFIGYGETNIFGRKAGAAETLLDDVAQPS